MARKSRGRQKLEMVKMSNQSSLQVTFSKRRTGLFKKASELCTLCAAEVAIIVFSPGNKVFSFGHPNVESVFYRFIMGNGAQISDSSQLVEARNANVSQLNFHLTQVLEELEMENKKAEHLNRKKKESQSLRWWEKPIQELNATQLNELKVNLQHLKQVFTKHMENMILQQTSVVQYATTTAPPINNYNISLPPPVPAPVPLNTFNYNNTNDMMMLPQPPIQPSPEFFNGGMFSESTFNSSVNTLLPPTGMVMQSEPVQNFQPIGHFPPQHGLPDFSAGFNNGFQ